MSNAEDTTVLTTARFTQHLSPRSPDLFKSKFPCGREKASQSPIKELNIRKKPEFQHARRQVD